MVGAVGALVEGVGEAWGACGAEEHVLAGEGVRYDVVDLACRLGLQAPTGPGCSLGT